MRTVPEWIRAHIGPVRLPHLRCWNGRRGWQHGLHPLLVWRRRGTGQHPVRYLRKWHNAQRRAFALRRLPEWKVLDDWSRVHGVCTWPRRHCRVLGVHRVCRWQCADAGWLGLRAVPPRKPLDARGRLPIVPHRPRLHHRVGRVRDVRGRLQPVGESRQVRPLPARHGLRRRLCALLQRLRAGRVHIGDVMRALSGRHDCQHGRQRLRRLPCRTLRSEELHRVLAVPGSPGGARRIARVHELWRWLRRRLWPRGLPAMRRGHGAKRG